MAFACCFAGDSSGRGSLRSYFAVKHRPLGSSRGCPCAWHAEASEVSKEKRPPGSGLSLNLSNLINETGLSACGGRGGLVKQLCCASHFLYAEKQQRGVRARFHSAVGIVDVDVGFAKLGRDARKFSRTVWQRYLCHIILGIGQSFSVQNRFGRCYIVHYEMYLAPALSGRCLEGHDVHFSVRKSLA